MSDLISLSLSQLLSAVEIAVLTMTVGFLMLFSRTATRLRREHQTMSKKLEKLESDLRLLAMNTTATDSRVGRLERESNGMKATQNHLESRGAGQSNYAQAVNLVQRGWRIDDVESNCGLSRGEAELVYLLHGPGGALVSGKSAKHSKVNSI